MLLQHCFHAIHITHSIMKCNIYIYKQLHIVYSYSYIYIHVIITYVIYTCLQLTTAYMIHTAPRAEPCTPTWAAPRRASPEPPRDPSAARIQSTSRPRGADSPGIEQRPEASEVAGRGRIHVISINFF